MKVYLCEFIHPAAEAYLREYAEVLTKAEQLAEAEAVLSRNLRIDAEFLKRAPKLQVIGVHGTGIDGVDLALAEEKGIEVFATPGRNAQSVAELNVALALELSRKLPAAHQALGKLATAELKGFELSGKTAGFIGTGNIAACTAKILCDGFGMRGIGYSPSYTPSRAEGSCIAYAPDVETVLRRADHLFLCTPLTPKTKGMIGAAELQQMKKTAYLINCARGGIVEEEALYTALKQGRLAGAACDVFANEPVLAEHPLLSLHNFIATPHIGANTEEALYRVGMAAVQGIVERLEAKGS